MIVTFTGETVQGRRKIELGVLVTESTIWQQLITFHAFCAQHQDIFAPISSLVEQHKKSIDDFESSSAVSLQLHVRGQPFQVLVGPHEDVDIMTNKLLVQHKLKPEVRSKIESEIIKTKLDAAKLFESKLVSCIALLQRRVGSVVIAEERANLSDQHVGRLSTSLSNIENTIPLLQIALEGYSDKAFDTDKEIISLHHTIQAERSNSASLMHDLEIERDNVLQMEQTAYDISGQLIEAKNKIEALTAERNTLRLKLKLKNAPQLILQRDLDEVGPASEEVQRLRQQRWVHFANMFILLLRRLFRWQDSSD